MEVRHYLWQKEGHQGIVDTLVAAGASINQAGNAGFIYAAILGKGRRSPSPLVPNHRLHAIQQETSASIELHC